MARLFAVCLTLPMLLAVSMGVRAASGEARARLRVHSAARRGGWASGPQAVERYELRVGGRLEHIYF